MIVRAAHNTTVVVRKMQTTWGSGYEVKDVVTEATRTADDNDSATHPDSWVAYMTNRIHHATRVPANWSAVY